MHSSCFYVAFFNARSEFVVWYRRNRSDKTGTVVAMHSPGKDRSTYYASAWASKPITILYPSDNCPEFDKWYQDNINNLDALIEQHIQQKD